MLIVLLLLCTAVFGIAGQSAAPESIAHIYAFAQEEMPDPNEGADPEEQEPPQAPPPPVELAIKDAPTSMKVGDTVTLSYTLNNAEIGTAVTWQSSNAEVAIVDSSGKVLAVSPGDVEITASVGDVKSSTLISISEIAAESIKIVVQEFSPADMLLTKHAITVGDTLHMTAKITPENAAVGEIIWSVSDEDVVKIDENGLLTVLAEGDATITVSAGELSDHIDVAATAKTESGLPIPLIVSIAAAVLLVAGLIIILVLWQKRRRAAEERERTAAKKREDALREKIRQEEAERLKEQGYMKGYIDSERETTDRMTRIFTPDAEDMGNTRNIIDGDEDESDGESDRPFSLDDID
jgi:hypothetical protein